MSRVLVVDDEEAYRSLMAGHLERKGMAVVTAADGGSALKTMDADGPFDVVVTDLMMPNMSGLDLLKAVKTRDPGTEVIIITASNEVDKAVSAMREGGAYDYLLKPLESIGELSLTVGRAIQRRQLLDEQQRLHDELDREASLLQALVTYSGEAMLLVDGSANVTVANPAAVELLKVEDIVGSDIHDALPEELLALVESWQGMGAQEPSVVEIDWPSDQTHLVSIAPIGSTQTGESGWVMILRDISHLKQIDELRLRMLNDAASKIRLPLAEAISKLADLSSATIEEDTRNATVYQLATILARIQEWIDELLALVQVEAGIGFSSEVMAISRVLNEQMKVGFEDAHKAKGLRLELDISDDLPEIRVDPSLFSRMLTGLLQRAAGRSQTGGCVGIHARRHEGQVWIELSDQGLPSKRTDALENQSGVEDSSSGFNLQMVRTIVQKLGGQVWVRGQDRIGSTIAISLPAAEG